MSGSNNRPPSAETYERLIEALRRHRSAALAAREVGVSATYAWRIAKKEDIKLISQSEHMKRRQADPTFQARLHSPLATEARRKAVKHLHAKRKARKDLDKAVRVCMKQLNKDPSFREISSPLGLKKALTDPAFQEKLLEVLKTYTGKDYEHRLVCESIKNVMNLN